MRVEPPPSLACAIGTMPAATAVAEPPEEPPLVRVGSHGLRVGPKRLVLVHGRMPHSGSVVDPDDDEAGLLEATHDVVVVGRLPVAEEVGGEGQPLAGDRAVVLDRDRHARERALVAGADLVGRRERVLGEDVDERVELGVERVDAVQRGLHELARGQLAGADEAGELARRAEEEVGHGAGA